ncbi:MAG: type II toxin-antitoxin system ParD family antitoxin [Planctomycetota bacterium]
MIELTPQQQAFVDQQIALGDYRDPAEVVQAGLELLRQEAADRESRATVADIHAAMAERERGEGSTIEESMARIRAELGLGGAE